MDISKIDCKYDKDNHIAIASLDIDGRKFFAYAKCSENDLDMESRIVGYEIVSMKIMIKALKEYKRDLKLGLASLKQLYYSMNRSKHFNEKSYENKMLQSQIQLFENDLATVNNMIANETKKLKEYIQDKENFYKKIRIRRNKGNSN